MLEVLEGLLAEPAFVVVGVFLETDGFGACEEVGAVGVAGVDADSGV